MSTFSTSAQFLAACDGKPKFHGKQQHLDYLPLENKSISVTDARSLERAPEIDREGFQLVNYSSEVADFFHTHSRKKYLREIEKLVTSLTGAELAVALGNGVIRRSERAGGYRKDGTTVPGRFAHCDFSGSPQGSEYWVDLLLPEREAKRRKMRRFAIYNVWRSLTAPPQDSPLALCDAQSICDDDVVNCDQILDDRIPVTYIENSLFRYNPAQRWYCYTDIKPDQVLIFKGFDSDKSKAQGVAHMAVDLPPQMNANTVPRESIDERVLAFF